MNLICKNQSLTADIPCKNHLSYHNDKSAETDQYTNIIFLKNEGFVSSQRLSTRKAIAQILNKIPQSFFAYWQILNIESGCRHSCEYCSQESGSKITSLTKEGLEDILSAILTVAKQRFEMHLGYKPNDAPIVGYGFSTYRPGIMKLYYDNDSGNSPILIDAIRHLVENFGVKSRLSMVAYSRHDKNLQLMHEDIVRHCFNGVDSIRFSFSSQTLGWRQNRKEFLLDYANMLKTWKPFVDRHRGSGRYHGAITEFRMNPDIETTDSYLDDNFLFGHHVVHFGPVLFISTEERTEKPLLNEIIGVEGRAAKFRDILLDYTCYISDGLIRYGDWRAFAENIIKYVNFPMEKNRQIACWKNFQYSAKRGGLACLQNSDGPFYAFDPTFQEDGIYEALNLYPRTRLRNCSGLFEETRWCLNSLLKYKKQIGLERRECYQNATWNDVDCFINIIKQEANSLKTYNKRAAFYIEQNILPLVIAFEDVLKIAEYGPEFIFDPNFTYFSGPFYNMGRATPLFKGLVSKADEPITAAEMREYYLTYCFESPTKLSPVPLLLENETPHIYITGSKVPRMDSEMGSIVFEELNRIDAMRPTNSFYISKLVGLMRR